MLDRRLDRTRTGRFWVYVGDRSHPCTVFTYTPTRNRDGPQNFLAGWSGFLHADAFGGYDGIYAGEAGGQVTEVACWAHARRKFNDARNADAAVGRQALAYIRWIVTWRSKRRKLRRRTVSVCAGKRTWRDLVSSKTRQRPKVDPFAYLRNVLTCIPATLGNELEPLLPDRWSKPN